MTSRDLYDERPYTDHAYAETHPGRIAAVARMARWQTPGRGRARILELGCGRGGNLLPMAAGLPEATLVGVDGLGATDRRRARRRRRGEPVQRDLRCALASTRWRSPRARSTT